MGNSDIYTYDPTLQAAQIARQQKMAELLQQQAEQPIDIQSYQGTQAPISWGSVLAKALKSGLGTYLGGKADQDAAALQSKSLAEAKAYYDPNYNVNIPGYSTDVTLDMSTPGNAMASAPNPSINPEDLQGPMNAPSVNPEDLQAGPTPDQNPRGLKIPDISSAPQQYTLGVGPSTGTATYSPEEQMSRARAAQFSSNPLIRSAAAGEMARLKPEIKEVGVGGLARIDADGNVSMVATPPTKPENLDPEEQYIAQELRINPNASIADIHKRYAQAGHIADASAGWQVAVDPTNNTTYRFNMRTGQALDFQNQPYTPGGYAKVATNNPRGAMNIHMADWNKEHPNAKEAEKTAEMNKFVGDQAEARVLGSLGGKVGSASGGLDIMLNNSNDTYDKLANSRGGFVPFNKLKSMWDTDVLSDKDQSDAYAADVGAINKWATAIGGASGLTIRNQEMGEKMLSQAQSLDAHRVVIERMRKEGAAALKGIQDRRGGATAPGGGAAAPGAGGAGPANLPSGTVYSPSRKQYRDPSGNLYDQNGKPL